MTKFEIILNRLKEFYNVTENPDLVKSININRSTFDTWMNRKSIPIKQLHNIAYNENISLNWLFFGIGEKSLNKSVSQSESELNLKNSNEEIIINLDNSCINKEEIKDILKLLEFAPKPYLNKVKLQLEKMKKLVEEN